MPRYDTKKKKQMTLLFKKPLLVLLAHKRTLRRAGKTTYLYRPNYKAQKKKNGQHYRHLFSATVIPMHSLKFDLWAARRPPFASLFAVRTWRLSSYAAASRPACSAASAPLAVAPVIILHRRSSGHCAERERRGERDWARGRDHETARVRAACKLTANQSHDR